MNILVRNARTSKWEEMWVTKAQLTELNGATLCLNNQLVRSEDVALSTKIEMLKEEIGLKPLSSSRDSFILSAFAGKYCQGRAFLPSGNHTYLRMSGRRYTHPLHLYHAQNC
jgi:hypothetical protein